MPNRNNSQSERQPKQGTDRQDQQRGPGRQQEQQGDRSRQQGEMGREKDRYSNDF